MRRFSIQLLVVSFFTTLAFGVQGQVLDAAPMGAVGKRHCVSIHPVRVLGGFVDLAYERAFASRSSWMVETGFTAHGINEALSTHGVSLQGAYKFLFLAKRRNVEVVTRGRMASGFFFKMGLAAIEQWQTYDCYRGNQGWQLLTERHTYTSFRMAATLALGHQHVGSGGFFFSEQIGLPITFVRRGALENGSSVAGNASLLNGFYFNLSIGFAF
ncbi:MAG: hypothetical protein IJV22_00600 [Bacteroidales bacterium]|nr:hypothetical protein [Bacteroidales bacterium]